MFYPKYKRIFNYEVRAANPFTTVDFNISLLHWREGFFCYYYKMGAADYRQEIINVCQIKFWGHRIMDEWVKSELVDYIQRLFVHECGGDFPRLYDEDTKQHLLSVCRRGVEFYMEGLAKNESLYISDMVLECLRIPKYDDFLNTLDEFLASITNVYLGRRRFIVKLLAYLLDNGYGDDAYQTADLL